MKTFLFGVATSLVASFAFPAVGDLVIWALVRAFGWLPIQGKTKLSGEWHTTWHVQSERFPPAVTDSKTRVRQLGKRVFVRFNNGNLTFLAKGLIDGGRYLTGTWQDETQGGYHGAFQLIIDPNTRDMAGLWVGYSTSGIVKQGRWEWCRNPPNPFAERTD